MPVHGDPALDPKVTGQTRWVTGWKSALNAFAITFTDRMAAAETKQMNPSLAPFGGQVLVGHPKS